MKNLFKLKPSSRTPLQSAVKYYLAAIMFGLPLIMTDAYFNITETKSVYFLLTSGIFFIVCLLLPQAKKSPGVLKEQSPLLKRLSFSVLDKSIILFMVCLLISSVLSPYQADTWLGLSSRYQGFFTMLIYAAVYFIVSRNYTSSESFIHFSILGFTAVCIFGILNCFDIDLLGVYDGISAGYKTLFLSTIGNINFYSSYMCLLMPVVVCGFCQSTKKSQRVIYTLSLIVGSWGMMLTSSESFALGFACSLMIMPMFFYNNLSVFKKYLHSIIIITVSTQLFNLILSGSETANISLSAILSIFVNAKVAVLVFILCAAFYLIAEKFPSKIRIVKRVYPVLLITGVSVTVICFILSNTVGLGQLDEIFEITSDWGTERGKIWRYCLKTYHREYSIKEMIFGTGLESLYHITAPADLFAGKNLDQAHNEYLQYLMTTGLVGLASYLGIIACVIFTVIKRLKRNAFAVALFAALVSYWMQACVNIAQPFTTPIVYIYIACIMGVANMEARRNSASP